MIYDIILPERLELWLARVTGYFDNEETEIYDSLNNLKRVLRNGADIEKLHAYRHQEIGRVYRLYSNSRRNNFKPSFHKKIHQLIKLYDERIKSLEEVG